MANISLIYVFLSINCPSESAYEQQEEEIAGYQRRFMYPVTAVFKHIHNYSLHLIYKQSCFLLGFLTFIYLIPLSHYSRNAPRIHNVGHFFQIAKVPSGVCKFRPAFLLDSVTFVAIAKCSQMQLRVGNLFHFPQNS